MERVRAIWLIVNLLDALRSRNEMIFWVFLETAILVNDYSLNLCLFIKTSLFETLYHSLILYQNTYIALTAYVVYGKDSCEI